MRTATWDIDLVEFVKSRQNTPFKWGEHDCTLFAADCVKVMTGIDLAEGNRNYSSKQAAYLIVGKYGGIRKLVTSVLDSECLPTLAQRGDVVLFTDSGECALGIHLGNTIVCAGEKGLVYRQPSDAIIAWRVV